jgi:hypothetical protein
MTIATYHGSCQCGAVQFTAELDLDSVVTCNCSRCRRLGSVLTFAPADKFHLEAGAHATTEYLFNKHAISHRFCATCGIEAYAMGSRPDGVPMAAVNVNCLDGVDARALTAHHHDGASA